MRLQAGMQDAAAGSTGLQAKASSKKTNQKHQKHKK